MYCYNVKQRLNGCENNVYLLLIQAIGHKTSLSTSQVTATSLSRVTDCLTNHISYYNPVSESESRGGIKDEVFLFFMQGRGNPKEMCGITLGVSK